MADSRRGSSISNLLKLASDNGLHCVVFEDLGVDALASFESPALLHLRIRSDETCGGHWVTFLGIQDRRAVVYDSLRSPNLTHVKLSDLLTRWDGIALQVSRDPISTLSKLTTGASGVSYRVFLVAICVFSVVIAGAFINSTRTTNARTFSTLCCATIVSTCAVHLTDVVSVFRNPLSGNWMAQDLFVGDAFEDASYNDLLDGQRAGASTVLVDARARGARKQFVIPGSVQIGVDFDIVAFRAAIEGIDPLSRIVVYCNSEDCMWAEMVAHRLCLSGFEDIKVFRRGVVGYLEDSVSKSE